MVDKIANLPRKEKPLLNDEIAINDVGGGNIDSKITVSKLLNISPPVTNYLTMPDLKRWGIFMSTGGSTLPASSAIGLFADILSTGTLQAGTRDAEGVRQRFTTGAVVGNQAGFRDTVTVNLFRRSERCRLKFKIKLVTTTVQRFYFGFKGTSAFVPNTDDPLLTDGGVGLCIITTSTNWQMAYNDVSGSTVFTDLGIPISTTTITVEIKADDNNTGFQWSINGGDFSRIQTSDVPASAQDLIYHAIITTNETVAKNFEVFWVLVGNNL